MRMWAQSLASLSTLRIWHCCKFQHRLQIRLRPSIAVAGCRPAAVALIRHLAQELPHAIKAKQNKNLFVLYSSLSEK